MHVRATYRSMPATGLAKRLTQFVCVPFWSARFGLVQFRAGAGHAAALVHLVGGQPTRIGDVSYG